MVHIENKLTQLARTWGRSSLFGTKMQAGQRVVVFMYPTRREALALARALTEEKRLGRLGGAFEAWVERLEVTLDQFNAASPGTLRLAFPMRMAIELHAEELAADSALSPKQRALEVRLTVARLEKDIRVNREETLDTPHG